MSSVVLATRRLYALGYSYRSDGSGVLHAGKGSPGERYRELAAALADQSCWREAAALRAMADYDDAFAARDFATAAAHERRAVALLGGVSR